MCRYVTTNKPFRESPARRVPLGIFIMWNKILYNPGDSVNGTVMVKDLGSINYNGNKEKRRYGVFECKFCGNHFTTLFKTIMSGATKSCGCNYNHTHRMSHSRIYKIWNSMNERCRNPNIPNYHNYGGRGIRVCDEWTSFIPFYEWSMKNNYDETLAIDRMDNDGNYEPGNCRWVTNIVNNQNSRLIHKNNTSGYRGVVFSKRNNNFISAITSNGRARHLGCFKTPEEAALAYNNYVIEHKTHHPLNIIPELST